MVCAKGNETQVGFLWELYEFVVVLLDWEQEAEMGLRVLKWKEERKRGWSLGVRGRREYSMS